MSLAACFWVWEIFGVTPDILSMNRAVQKNEYFLRFINVSISNFASQRKVKDLKEAFKHDISARLALLRSDYSEAYEEVRKSQKILTTLFHNALANIYEGETQSLLDLAAPIILRSNDRKAEFLLRLGYRDLEVSKKYLSIGFHSNRFLYSNKIGHYINGIKRARRAKRFALLAIIESKTPREEKSEYRVQTLDEALNREAQEEEKITDYDRVKTSLQNLINRRLISIELADRYRFLLQHSDNYGLIGEGKASAKLNFLDEFSLEDETDTKGAPGAGEGEKENFSAPQQEEQ